VPVSPIARCIIKCDPSVNLLSNKYMMIQSQTAINMVINADVYVWSVVCIASGKCTDSLVKFKDRMATKAVHIQLGTTLDACKSQCLSNSPCVGLNWSSGRNKCSVQLHMKNMDTTKAPGVDLYVREVCVPGMYRVRQITVIPCLFC